MVTAIHDAHALVSAASRAQPRRRGCLIHAETLAWLGLRSLLTDSSSITLVGEAVTETQALHAAPTRPPATASGHGQRQSRRHAASCLNLVDAPRSPPFSLGQRSEWPVLAHP